ncbi:MAG: YihY family inner membrane protein, partial [Laribacter sp.]|nr:YihY family inner membrane protein [Laribacter sp.]
MLRLSRPPLPPLLQRLTGFSLFVWRRAMQNRCLQVAASLTFTTLLSLVPLITITLIVVAAFPVFEELSSQFKEFLLRNLVPDFAGRIISVYLKQFTDNAGRLTAVGLALLAFTSLSLMLTIDRTFNAIWQVQRPRKLLHNMLVYWTV